jgi:hypothetical protein
MLGRWVAYRTNPDLSGVSELRGLGGADQASLFRLMPQQLSSLLTAMGNMNQHSVQGQDYAEETTL